MMFPKDILKEVAIKGTCEHIRLIDCRRCPLGTLKKRSDESSWLSCYESICGEDIISEQEQIERYKNKATELLADIALEESLKEET